MMGATTARPDATTGGTSRSYCTMFDSGYLLRGLAMCESLRRVGESAVIHALCLDAESETALRRLAPMGVRPVSLRSLLDADPELASIRHTRSPAEFIFACTPSWVRHVLKSDPDAGGVTYLDADLYFFASPAPVYGESPDASVLIIPHRFPPHARSLERFGVYNVGLVHFRRDETAHACLASWRSQCIEWSSDTADGARFADQKYLDDWPVAFAGVHVVQSLAAGVGPWNWCVSQLGTRAGVVYAEGVALIFFHFHGFRALARWLFDTGASVCGVMPKELREAIHGRYAAELRDLARRLEPTIGQVPIAGSSRASRGWTRWPQLVLSRRLLTTVPSVRWTDWIPQR